MKYRRQLGILTAIILVGSLFGTGRALAFSRSGDASSAAKAVSEPGPSLSSGAMHSLGTAVADRGGLSGKETQSLISAISSGKGSEEVYLEDLLGVVAELHRQYGNGEMIPVTLPPGVDLRSNRGAGSGDTDIGVMSATGCNGRVCITVEGAGVGVDNWYSTTYHDGVLCDLFADFTADNVRVSQAYYEDCWGIPGSRTYWSAFHDDLPTTFADRTQLCNKWYPDPPLDGRPCILIKA